MGLLWKRSWLVALVCLLVIAASVTSVLAQASGPVDADASTDINTPGATTNDDRLRIEAGTPSCVASRTRVSFVKWDVTAVNQAVGSASMTFGVQSVSLGNALAGNQQVVLYATTDGWTETTVNWSNQPALGAVLQSVVVPSTGGGTVVFNSPELAAYVQQEANGDNTASFALALTGSCGESTVTLRLFSKDSTVGPDPTLQILGPTAVEMTQTSAERVSWPLYAGLAAVALFVVAGVMISRRRTA